VITFTKRTGCVESNVRDRKTVLCNCKLSVCLKTSRTLETTSTKAVEPSRIFRELTGTTHPIQSVPYSRPRLTHDELRSKVSKVPYGENRTSIGFSIGRSIQVRLSQRTISFFDELSKIRDRIAVLHYRHYYFSHFPYVWTILALTAPFHILLYVLINKLTIITSYWILHSDQNKNTLWVR
jgi:hypothetical protein